MVKNAPLCTLIEKKKDAFVFHKKLGPFYTNVHQHTKGQLIFTESGWLHMDINGHKFLLPTWYCAWVPPHTLHKVWSGCESAYIRSVYFESPHCQLSCLQEPAIFPISNLLKEMIVYSEKWNDEQASNTEELIFLEAIKNTVSDEIKKAVKTQLPSTAHQQLLPVLEFIQNHLDTTITIGQLAKTFGISERTFNRLFMAELGIPYASYLKIARILKALELIENGHEHISEVAFTVGYQSISSFSNNFLEICGYRPCHFVRKVKADGIKPHTI